MGDGTTTIICLVGDIMNNCKVHIENNVHPITIVKTLFKSLEYIDHIVKEISIPIDINIEEDIKKSV